MEWLFLVGLVLGAVLVDIYRVVRSGALPVVRTSVMRYDVKTSTRTKKRRGVRYDRRG